MQRSIPVLALALLFAGGGCSRSHNKSVDTALNNDLSLAAQQRGARLDSMAEGTPSANALNGTSSPAANHRSTTYAHRSGASGGSGGTVVKHTGRDAAIGAAAGAVLGAATSHNKVKGGLIGAAVGGIIGGVIGNNVDKKKVPQ